MPRIVQKPPIIINITAKHIKNAVRNDPFQCAVALALREKTNLDWVIYVDTAYYHSYDRLVFYQLPNEVIEFVKEFDTGKQMLPVAFGINL